ncbi:uncharacterized protein RCO7_08678 [Rhynchosporium graminicola]|uniref:L-arabinokinase n=1 Tax=Rhynchosporium graminicola TaxID=2792576 RepID=A0A1E1LMJ0_9HELO|nr:uncharacterized protein RCO7_08678 [Rhynchosporium commune]
MLRICYYITGHGFGHATRSSQVISALLSASPTTHVTIIATAPKHLFPDSPRLTLIPYEVDSEIVQPQPYTIDPEASLSRLATFLAKAETPEWQSKMDKILDDTNCNLVVSDASYGVAWKGAKERGIKRILASNFSFDAIFEKLLTLLSEQTTRTEREEKEELINKVTKMYAEFDHVIRFPGHIPLPFVNRYWSAEQQKTKISDAPLVYRPSRTSREEVLKGLEVPEEMMGCKVLLVQFGGLVLQKTGATSIPNLPEGWICLFSEAVDDKRFFRFPKDVYAPDLVSAADMVLGKIGYGTVSECVGMNTALVYVSRPQFEEEHGLVSYMQKMGICREIPVAAFESGEWVSAIELLHKYRESRTSSDIEEGSSQVAKMIEELASGP